DGPRDAQPRPGGGTEAGDVLSVEDDAALLRMVDAADAVQQAGLAGAGRADDGAQGRLLHREAHVLQGGDAAEAQHEVRNVEEGGRHPTKDYMFAVQRETGPGPPEAGGASPRRGSRFPSAQGFETLL